MHSEPITRLIHGGRARLGIGDVLVFAERPDKVIASAHRFGYMDKWGEVLTESDSRIQKRIEMFLEDQANYKLFKEYGGVTLVNHHNAYVNTGLNNSLDREWGLGGTAIGFIGVSSNTTAVTAATTFLNGASGGAAANTIILAISPAATRTSQTTTGGATFTNASFTSGVFVQNKLGLLTTSTDAGTGLVDVIGGTGGSSPYNRTFSLDLTNAGTFTEVAQIAVTAVAV